MTDNLPLSSPQRIPAARLLRPQGRRGELLAELLTDLPNIFAAGRRASLKDPATAFTTETTIESSWSPTGRNAGRIVLKLSGVDTISAAELLVGRELYVLSSDLPQLEADTWFVRDLVGCDLFDGSNLVGQIAGVEYPMSADGKTRLPDAAPLLEVTGAEYDRSNTVLAGDEDNIMSSPVLIPFVKAWLDSVDLEARRVVMHLPPGLLDLGG